MAKLTFNSIMDSYYKGHEDTIAGQQWKADRKSGKAKKMFHEIGGKLSKIKALETGETARQKALKAKYHKTLGEEAETEGRVQRY